MFNVFRNLLSFEAPASRVLDVKTDSYTAREICYRDDGMVLYAPTAALQKAKQQYEIVLHRPCTESLKMAFSLFRSSNKGEAEIRFVTYKDKVPVFVEISKELCNAASLQKICDELTQHPTWSLAHLAACLALSEEVFSHPAINSHLNSSDSESGMSPLQVAAHSGYARTVDTLLGAKASLAHLDHGANSVFHYAASTNKEVILALCRSTASVTGTRHCLNSRNCHGYTPLHLACLADKPECVKALLVAGADVNIECTRNCNAGDNSSEPGYVVDFILDHPNKLYQQDMKYGGTPLHWSCSRPVIEALIQRNCNVNALNFDGRTALHIMVMRDRLECVVALLSHGADPNVGDMLDGNMPLHLAVAQPPASVSIAQSLLVFGADFNRLNNHGSTARHLVSPHNASSAALLLHTLHAVGAKRCEPSTTACTDGCRFDGTFDGTPPPAVIGPHNRDVLNQMLSVAGMETYATAKTQHTERLLCLDGGGIRGLVLIQMLLELQQFVQKPIVECFDWIAGTSTGGIMALALASGKSLQQILCLYFRMKEHTFVGNRPYPSEALENILKECFGADTVMTDIKHPKLLIAGVLADRKPVELHLFRNYECPSDILGVVHNSPYELPPPPAEQLLWHVGRATGAAPSYFRAFGRYLDGGLVANNPTLDALTEIHEYGLALRAKGLTGGTACVGLKAVVSLGTGVVPVTQLKEIDVFRPESIWDSAKLMIGISAIGGLLVDQATASDGRVVDRARAWCSMIGVPYFRFSPQMSEDIAMDEKSDEKLVRMLWETKVYMHNHISSIQELAVLLA